MSLNKALENLKFDKRLLDLNLKQGRITKDEYAKYSEALPDLKEQCETLKLEKEEAEELI